MATLTLILSRKDGYSRWIDPPAENAGSNAARTESARILPNQALDLAARKMNRDLGRAPWGIAEIEHCAGR